MKTLFLILIIGILSTPIGCVDRKLAKQASDGQPITKASASESTEKRSARSADGELTMITGYGKYKLGLMISQSELARNKFNYGGLLWQSDYTDEEKKEIARRLSTSSGNQGPSAVLLPPPAVTVRVYSYWKELLVTIDEKAVPVNLTFYTVTQSVTSPPRLELGGIDVWANNIEDDYPELLNNALPFVNSLRKSILSQYSSDLITYDRFASVWEDSDSLSGSILSLEDNDGDSLKLIWRDYSFNIQYRCDNLRRYVDQAISHED